MTRARSITEPADADVDITEPAAAGPAPFVDDCDPDYEDPADGDDDLGSEWLHRRRGRGYPRSHPPRRPRSRRTSRVL